MGARGNIPPKAFHREERASGKFVRTITLPVEIDESNVAAEYKNGLLLITLPRENQSRSRCRYPECEGSRFKSS